MAAAAAAAVEKEIGNNSRHIPPEIVEKILIHLPMKSLYRFSRVSKPWRSLIFDPSFVKKRAAVSGVRRLLVSPNYSGRPEFDPDLVLEDASSFPLSSVSSDNAVVEDATPITFPIEGKPIVRASYGELCCVELNNYFYLWNPSINTYKKLRTPSPWWNCFTYDSIFGFGYDSVTDDYKIFRLQLRFELDHKSELYSLRSDSWRSIDHHPLVGEYIPKQRCVFVGGALHWWSRKSIISFDLSTERYGSIALPPSWERTREVFAFGGKLCVNQYSKRSEFKFVLWEYGIKESWTKMFVIKNADGIPVDSDRGRAPDEVMPLYLFDNGEMLFRICTSEKELGLFMYNGEETRPWKMICRGFSDGFVYDEGLFSPLKFEGEALFSPLEFEKLSVGKKQGNGR